MTFKTPKPFFPYREPSDQRENVVAKADAKTAEPPPSRLLRVFFIGPGRASGVVGEGGPAWPGETVWAGSFATQTIAHTLAPLALPFAEAWLTTFEDRSNPRPGTDDVFFSTNKDASPVRPPPVVVVRGQPLFVPLDVLALLGFGVAWIVKRRRRRAAQSG